MSLLLELGSVTLSLIWGLGRRPLGLQNWNKNIRVHSVWNFPGSWRRDIRRFHWGYYRRTRRVISVPGESARDATPFSRGGETRSWWPRFGIGTRTSCSFACRISRGRAAHSRADGCRPAMQISDACIFTLVLLSACAFRGGAKRHPIWFSFGVSWIVSPISYSLLFLAGRQCISPAKALCIAQAGLILIYAVPFLQVSWPFESLTDKQRLI